MRQLISATQHRWWVRRSDNIGAKRLAEGGVSASGAGSAKAVANTINSHYTKNGKANVEPQSTAAH
jgi:hypothetical protein